MDTAANPATPINNCSAKEGIGGNMPVGDESDGDVVDMECGMTQGTQTFMERMKAHVNILRNFSDGLEYQIQFGDTRMLDHLEWEGRSLFRLVENCLSRECHMNSTRGGSLTTWESTMANAMYYRMRPPPHQ